MPVRLAAYTKFSRLPFLSGVATFLDLSIGCDQGLFLEKKTTPGSRPRSVSVVSIPSVSYLPGTSTSLTFAPFTRPFLAAAPALISSTVSEGAFGS